MIRSSGVPIFRVNTVLTVAECDKQAEVFFLVEASSNIWHEDFEKQLIFVSDVIDSFEIGPENIRVGVATFSDMYKQEISLGDDNNKESLQAAVKKIYQILGGTRTDTALEGVRTQGLTSTVVRQDVARIAIVIANRESDYPDRTETEAEQLKEDGVVVFAVGIGDIVELKDIVSEPAVKYLYNTGSYNDLNAILKEQLAKKICQGKLP